MATRDTQMCPLPHASPKEVTKGLAKMNKGVTRRKDEGQWAPGDVLEP
jgi:hypothetical protein